MNQCVGHVLILNGLKARKRVGKMMNLAVSDSEISFSASKASAVKILQPLGSRVFRVVSSKTAADPTFSSFFFLMYLSNIL